jgi:hypothetical protein
MQPPEGTTVEALLEPDLDELTTRGGGADDDARSPLRRRLLVTSPVHARIDVEDVPTDPELQRFIERESDRYAFHALRLACTFRPEDGEPFTECWVGIDLRRSDDSPDEPPLAWSMQPQRLDRVTQLSSKFTYSAQLKLSVAGLGVSGERGTSGDKTTAYLQAYGELGAAPWWELYRIKGVAELRGMQELRLVVRTPATAPVDGKASIEAKVERRKYGVMRYVVSLPGDPPTSQFRLE